MRVEELANLLGREQVQLEFLLFKVLQLQHLLLSGDVRFLRWSAEEIRRASQRVHDIEATRDRQILVLCREAGVDTDGVSLELLADRSPEPWRSIFADHALGFTRLQREVDDAVSEARRLAEATGHAIADVLHQIRTPAQAGLVPRQIRLDNPMVLP